MVWLRISQQKQICALTAIGLLIDEVEKIFSDATLLAYIRPRTEIIRARTRMLFEIALYFIVH